MEQNYSLISENEKQTENENIRKKQERIQRKKKLRKKNDENTIKNYRDKANKHCHNLLEDLKLNKYENIDQIIESYQPYEKITKKVVNPNISKRLSYFMLYIILPLFNIFYLLAIFEYLSIMRIIFKIFKNSIKFYFSKSESSFSIKEFNKNYNFFSIFVEENKKDSFDFNLIFLTGTIGRNCLKKCGFRTPAIIFSVSNIFFIFVIYCISFFNYGEDYNIDNKKTIAFLFLLCSFLFITVGASALLSLQISTDKMINFYEYLKKTGEESKYNEEKKISMNSDIENCNILNYDEFVPDNLDKKNIEQNEIKEVNDSVNVEETNSIINSNQNIDEKENNLIILRDNINEIPEKIIRSKTSDSEIINFNFNERSLSTKIKIKKNHKKDNSENKYFLFVSAIIVFAYIIFDFINLFIINRKKDKIDEYMDIVGCTKDIICYENFIKDKNLSITNEKLYYEIININIKDYSKLVLIIAFICLIFVFLSIIFYSIFTYAVFTKDENQQSEKNDEINFSKICCILAIREGNICNCMKKNCCSIIKCLLNCFFLCLNTLINCICQCFNKEKEIKDYIDCYDEDEVEEIEDEKDKKCTLECIETQRICTYINEFISSDIMKKLSLFLAYYFLLQLTALGFESQYFQMKNKEEIPHQNKINGIKLRNEVNFILLSGKNDNNENNNILKTIEKNFEGERFYIIITIILSFYLFIYFSISYTKIRKIFQIGFNSDNIEIKNNEFTNIMNILSGIDSILFFNGIYSFIFSLLYFFKFDFDSIKIIKELYLIPILMCKFYNLTLIYFCVGYSEEIQRIDINKGSTWISIFLFLWNLIIDYIITFDIYILYIIQSIFSGIICFAFLILIVYGIVKIISFECSKILSLLCFLLLYFSCVFGFFINEKRYKSFNNFIEKLFTHKNPSII